MANAKQKRNSNKGSCEKVRPLALLCREKVKAKRVLQTSYLSPHSAVVVQYFTGFLKYLKYGLP